ncbi:hypothetical protein CH50_03625, partial [Paenibacillus darwinianus]
MEEHTVCPWCDTEIVWDEELGPEEYCPHCENDLKAYRTVSFSIDEEAGAADGAGGLRETTQAADGGIG